MEEREKEKEGTGDDFWIGSRQPFIIVLYSIVKNDKAKQKGPVLSVCQIMNIKDWYITGRIYDWQNAFLCMVSYLQLFVGVTAAPNVCQVYIASFCPGIQWRHMSPMHFKWSLLFAYAICVTYLQNVQFYNSIQWE